MGCGCGRKQNANLTPSRQVNPATQVNKLAPKSFTNTETNQNFNSNPETNNIQRSMINSDRVRIERLRREAIARARGIQ